MDVLPKLRSICLALPEARETTTFGHPTFQAGKKTFAVLDEYAGEPCLVVKLPLPRQQAVLKSPRYFPSPYGAKHGWVCLKTAGKIDLAEVRELCVESYREVALVRMLAALDDGAGPRGRSRKAK
jgi:predicted DNA-binding protein (MmcQ/YjbR family)